MQGIAGKDGVKLKYGKKPEELIRVIIDLVTESGDFIYLELMKWNGKFVEDIQKAKTKEELRKLWETTKKKAFLSYKVYIKAVDKNAGDFTKLEI